MSASDARMLERVVDTERYPLAEPESAEWQRMVSRVRQELADIGCCVLADFIQPAMREVLRAEGAAIAPLAYYDVEIVNAYNIAVDQPLPENHPGRLTMSRGNAFVPRDYIDRDLIIHELYVSELFQHFVASCFALPKLVRRGGELRRRRGGADRAGYAPDPSTSAPPR